MLDKVKESLKLTLLLTIGVISTVFSGVQMLMLYKEKNEHVFPEILRSIPMRDALSVLTVVYIAGILCFIAVYKRFVD